MIDLERSLGELAERLQIPGGESLASDVVHRIRAPMRRQRHPHRALRLAGALMAVAVLVVVVALPGTRRAVARWLGFDSVRIEPGVTVPTTLPSTTRPPPPTSTTAVTAITASTATTVVDVVLDLGRSVSIAEAISQTGLPDPTPQLLGTPRSIHIVQPPASGQIVLVYAPSDLLPQSAVTGVGALVSVLPATIEEGLFGKTLGDTATVRAVDVEGAPGFWIEGSPHQVFFQTGGSIVRDTLRLATNTLLWERDGHVYRVEADISLDTALRIASSVR